MPVAAGVVGDLRIGALLVLAARDMTGAAVRQFSIADITLSWPRLTWPALAWRHAGPWPRKISATSNTRRDMAAGGYAGGGSFLLGFLRGNDSRSSGLSMAAIMPVATRV